jgi:hypothetical protein
MDYIQMTAPCGRDCFNCPLYLAKDNDRYRRIIAKRMEIPFEKAICKGCRDENGIISFLDMKEPCKILKCTNSRKINFCCDCPDFPYDTLHPLKDRATELPHNTKVFNLCLIRKMGLEAWAKNKAKSVFEKYYNGKLEDLFK